MFVLSSALLVKLSSCKILEGYYGVSRNYGTAP